MAENASLSASDWVYDLQESAGTDASSFSKFPVSLGLIQSSPATLIYREQDTPFPRHPETSTPCVEVEGPCGFLTPDSYLLPCSRSCCGLWPVAYGLHSVPLIFSASPRCKPAVAGLCGELRVQYYFPKLLALFQPLMGGPRLTQRKALVHHGFQFAGEDVLHHFMKISHRPHE